MLTLLLATCLLVSDEAPAKPAVIVVVGAAGSPEFGDQFQTWRQRWQAAAEKGGAELHLIGAADAGDQADKDQLKAALEKLAAESTAPVWLVLIGHGTYDGQAAKFNLRGPDVDASELAEWIAPLRRPLAVVNCSAASAPFINRLAGKDRVIITATRSGNEQNFSHFGEFVSKAIDDTTADLDKDGQVSLLEAYLTACRRVEEFYDEDARLATEHALLDDNGDGLGTPSAWFRGLRATQRAKDGASLDGTRAHQFHLIASGRELQLPAELRHRRDELEVQIAALRGEKERLGDDEFYGRLEPLMVELARIYAQIN